MARRHISLDVPLVLLCIKPHVFCFFFLLLLDSLTTSWWLINTSWVTLMKLYDVERPETPDDLGKNIIDNMVRGT